MRKIIPLFLFSITVCFANTTFFKDITDEIPLLALEYSAFHKIDDVAQYKNATWENIVGIRKNTSIDEAFYIANHNPEITYFFYVKADQLILETIEDTCRVFHKGDAIFFSGEPWWGSAPGLSDGYIKNS